MKSVFYDKSGQKDATATQYIRMSIWLVFVSVMDQIVTPSKPIKFNGAIPRPTRQYYVEGI